MDENDKEDVLRVLRAQIDGMRAQRNEAETALAQEVAKSKRLTEERDALVEHLQNEKTLSAAAKKTADELTKERDELKKKLARAERFTAVLERSLSSMKRAHEDALAALAEALGPGVETTLPWLAVAGFGSVLMASLHALRAFRSVGGQEAPKRAEPQVTPVT